MDIFEKVDMLHNGRSWAAKTRWLVLALLLVVGFTAVHVAAQEDDSVWDAPVNLSNAGSATNPLIVQDATGLYHLLWQDAFAGFVYRTGDGRNWNDAAVVQMPFTEPPFGAPGEEDFEGFYRPVLTADENGRMHAFWVNVDGELLYRRALVEELPVVNTWTAEARLSGSAVAVDALADAEGRLHLAYIRPQAAGDIVAGVYYRRSNDGGATWLDPILITESSYFQVTTPEQANIQLLLDADGSVHLVWDNAPLEKVFWARSADGGDTWPELIEEIDGRQENDQPEAPGPANIAMLAAGGDLHLTWQAAHGDMACSHYHKFSSDGGANWSEPTIALTDARGCAQESRLLSGADGLVFLMTTFADGTQLQAWDGAQWSEPELQMPLAGFTAEETFREVALGCLQPLVLDDNSLLVVGCGQGALSDIWALQRPLGDIADWTERFAPPPIWQEPENIARSDFELETPSLAVGADGVLHAVWSETQIAADGGRLAALALGAGEPIYYSRLDSERWFAPRPVLASPTGPAEGPQLVVSADDILHVVWSGGETGGVYYSRALAAAASSTGEWTEPVFLPGSEGVGAGQDLAQLRSGLLAAAYTVPANDARGVYVTTSADEGESWGEAVQVFNGRDADWQLVGQPRLATTGANTLHLLWTREGVAPGAGALALAYSRSDDGGQTWAEPVVIQEAPVVWYDLVGGGEREVHLTWITAEQALTTLWHEWSLDNGLTWGTPARLVDPATTPGATALLLNSANAPHLLQLVVDNEGELALQDWIWRDDLWRVGDGLPLDDAFVSGRTLAGQALPDGRIVAVFGGLWQDEQRALMADTLYYTSRDWEVTAVSEAPLPTLTPTPPPAPTITPTPPPAPTPTIAFADFDEEEAPSTLGALGSSPLGGVLLGVGTAVLVLVIILGVGLRFMRNR